MVVISWVSIMHAIILAAGRGSRLSEHNPEGDPKCLMEFGGCSLLARHQFHYTSIVRPSRHSDAV